MGANPNSKKSRMAYGCWPGGGTAMIRLENVSKTFKTGTHGLLDITLSVEKGEFIFLVGPTGSGKTTLFRLLIRETLPSKGKIAVADLDVSKLPRHKIPNLR